MPYLNRDDLNSILITELYLLSAVPDCAESTKNVIIFAKNSSDLVKNEAMHLVLNNADTHSVPSGPAILWDSVLKLEECFTPWISQGVTGCVL